MTEPASAVSGGARESTHGDYLMVLRVSGAAYNLVEDRAREIHTAFMAQYGGVGAMTVALYRLHEVQGDAAGAAGAGGGAVSDFALRFFGPTESLGWLQQQLERAAQDVGATVGAQAYTVTDITGTF